MNSRVFSISLVALAAALSLSVLAPTDALAQAKKKKGNDPNSLYNRLGGKAAITAVVDSFVAYVAADDRINSFFQTTVAKGGIPKFKKHLVNQICEASGGPCKYKGKSMKEAHRGMGVKGEHFGALVEDLIKALDHFKVGAKEKGELLAVLGPMKNDIVE